MNVYFREKTVANQKGLTLIELMIVVTIALSISGAVLAQFKVGEQSRNVRIAADDIQSALRLMQNNALSGIPYQIGPPPTPAQYFGWRIDLLLPTQHTTFVESPTNVLQVLENLVLPPQVTIQNLAVNCFGLCIADENALEVRFFPPFGAMEFHYRSANGAWQTITNGRATFQVRYGATARIRTITIDGISGRISVQ